MFLLFCLFPFPLLCNIWSQIYWLKLRLNICIDNSSSKGSSNSSTCNLLSSRAVLITSEAFSFNCLHNLISYLFIFTVEDIKSRSQKKHIKLCSNITSLLSYEKNFLFQGSLYFPASKSSLCVSFSLFCSSRKATSKSLPLVSCFGESKFCWQSAEIRFPYHLGSIYAKWLALVFEHYVFKVFTTFHNWPNKSTR